MGWGLRQPEKRELCVATFRWVLSAISIWFRMNFSLQHPLINRERKPFVRTEIPSRDVELGVVFTFNRIESALNLRSSPYAITSQSPQSSNLFDALADLCSFANAKFLLSAVLIRHVSCVLCQISLFTIAQRSATRSAEQSIIVRVFRTGICVCARDFSISFSYYFFCGKIWSKNKYSVIYW